MNEMRLARNPSTGEWSHLGYWALLKKILRQQYLLTKLLQYPISWVRWFPAVACALASVGLSIYLIKTQFDWDLPGWLNVVSGITMAISTALIMVTLILVCFLLPSQIVHMVTSKQSALLESFRRTIYWHIQLVVLVYAAVIAIVFGFKEESITAAIKIFLLAHLLISSFIYMSIYAGQKTAAWSFLFGFTFPIYQYLAIKLNSLDSLWLFFGTAACWCVFSIWWVNWRPSQHRAALFTETFTDPTRIQRLQSGFGQGIFSYLQFGLNKNIENIFEGVLLGRAKAPLRMMLIALMFPVIMISVLVFSFSMAPGSTFDVIKKSLLAQSFLFTMIFATQPAMQLMMVFHNIKKAWLFYAGERKHFFSVLERLLLVQTGVQLISIAVFVWLIATIFEVSMATKQLYLVAVVYGALISVLCLYLFALLYKLASGSRNAQTVTSIIVILILAVPVGTSGGILGDRLLTEYGFYLLILMIVLVGVMLAVRLIAKAKWQKIEFVRMR